MLCCIILTILGLLGVAYTVRPMYCDKKEIIRSQIRQVYRWYEASLQDQNPVIRLLHANYAVGWADSLMNIATDNEILIVSGLNIRTLVKKATAEQDKALVALAKICPDIVPDDEEYKKYLALFLQ